MKKTVLALLLLATPALAAEPDYAAIADRAATHAVELFEGFSQEASALAEAARLACEADSAPDAAEALTAAYHRAYAEWSGVAFLRFGPVEARSSALKLNFWPDKKNFVGRALRGMRQAEAAQQADPAFLAQQSVAVQGFPAVERLIFDEDRAPCPLAATIATGMEEEAAALAADWQVWAGVMRKAGPENPVYLTPKEAAVAAFTALDFGLEHLADQQLGRPLGTFERPCPRCAEGWRSAQAKPNAIAALAGLHAFSEAVFAGMLPDETQTALERRWAAAADALDRMPEISEGVASPATRIRIEAAQQRVRLLRETIAGELGERLGVHIGFNSADGD